MSEVKDCIDVDTLEEFLQIDCKRILKSFPNDELANGEEVIFFTERFCLQVPLESFRRDYPKVMKFFKEKNDLSNLICKKVELIMGGKDCGISGNTFVFKITFTKANI